MKRLRTPKELEPDRVQRVLAAHESWRGWGKANAASAVADVASYEVEDVRMKWSPSVEEAREDTRLALDETVMSRALASGAKRAISKVNIARIYRNKGRTYLSKETKDKQFEY